MQAPSILRWNPQNEARPSGHMPVMVAAIAARVQCFYSRLGFLLKLVSPELCPCCQETASPNANDQATTRSNIIRAGRKTGTPRKLALRLPALEHRTCLVLREPQLVAAPMPRHKLGTAVC